MKETQTQASSDELRLSDEDILVLNSRAAKVDTIIAVAIIAIGAVFGVQYTISYSPPVSDVIKSSVLLEAQDFIADGVFEGAEISQDETSGALVATKDGEILDIYLPDYGGVTLNISDYADGSPRYDVVFDVDGVNN